MFEGVLGGVLNGCVRGCIERVCYLSQAVFQPAYREIRKTPGIDDAHTWWDRFMVSVWLVRISGRIRLGLG